MRAVIIIIGKKQLDTVEILMAVLAILVIGIHHTLISLILMMECGAQTQVVVCIQAGCHTCSHIGLKILP